MKELEQRILKDGVVLNSEVLKVGSFLNQQLDTALIMKMGKEIARLFDNCGATKILTIESSGIALAFAAGIELNCPVVFAKKHKSTNVSGDCFVSKVFSFTHRQSFDITVSKEYIGKDDKVLIVDDFLATGEALKGLIDIVEQSGAELIGCSAAIEKGFQDGGRELREKGYRIESLAIIDEMDTDHISFRM